MDAAINIADLVGVIDQVDHTQHRVIQEALSAAESRQWRERAEMFRWAAPRRGDFRGNATPAELQARWDRCHEIANACDMRAELCPVDSWADDVADGMGGAA